MRPTPKDIGKARRLVAERHYETYGAPIPTANLDLHKELIKLIAYHSGHCNWLRKRINELAPEVLVQGYRQVTIKEATEWNGQKQEEETISYIADVNLWLKLYHYEMKELHNVLKTAIAAGIEEKRLEIMQEQGAQMLQVLQGAALRLGLELTHAEVIQALWAEAKALGVANGQ